MADNKEEPAPVRVGDSKQEDRRGFLKLATCALGGGLGLALGVPVVRFVIDPASNLTVTMPTDPIDVGAVEHFKVGADPRKVDVVAPIIKDAWVASRNVILGSAFIRRTAPDKIEALSSVCPHLGCAVSWDDAKKTYLCPCHDSRFALNGDRQTGPSERGLDPLPVAVKDGRLQLTWVRFKNGGIAREPV